MSRDTFALMLSQLVRAIIICIDNKLTLPALMLLYAGIDICGWLASPSDRASTCESFTHWVDKYLLPSKQLPVTAIELYAARCGLLHTYTPESHLSAAGKARKIAYAWGDAQACDLQKTIDLEGRSDLVALHVSDLLEAFRLGLLAFFADMEHDPSLAAAFEARSAKSFAPLSKDLIREYLDLDLSLSAGA